MFGLFYKKLPSRCAMCGAHLNIEIKRRDIPKIFDDPDRERFNGRAVLGRDTCPFCKTALVLTIDPRPSMWSYDEKWQQKVLKFEEKSEKLEDEIAELHAKKEAGGLTQAKEAKLDRLQERLDDLTDKFDDQEGRYEERRDKWREKRLRKK